MMQNESNGFENNRRILITRTGCIKASKKNERTFWNKWDDFQKKVIRGNE